MDGEESESKVREKDNAETLSMQGSRRRGGVKPPLREVRDSGGWVRAGEGILLCGAKGSS